MLELIKRIANYSKTERIQRLIEISVKGENASPFEQMECMMIQFIREQNGEIAEVKRMNKRRGPTANSISRAKLSRCFFAIIISDYASIINGNKR